MNEFVKQKYPILYKIKFHCNFLYFNIFFVLEDNNFFFTQDLVIRTFIQNSVIQIVIQKMVIGTFT